MGGFIHWHLPSITKQFLACAGGRSFRGEFSENKNRGKPLNEDKVGWGQEEGRGGWGD